MPDTSATAAPAPTMPPPPVLAAWSAGPEPSQLEAAEVALSAFKVSFHEQHGREPVYAELKLERIYRDWRRIHRAAKRMAALTGGKPVASLEAKPTAESAAERRSCISVVKAHVDTADSAGEMGLSDGVATKEAEGDDGGEGDGGEEDEGSEGDGGEEVTDGLALAEGTQPVAMPAQARWRFNQNPTRAVQWIVRGEGGDGALSGFGHAEIASEIALWLLTEDGLLTSKVGEFLGGAANLNRDVLAAYIGTLTPYFSGATLDTALRYFVSLFKLPGEAQMIDRILKAFAEAWAQSNPEGGGMNAEVAYVLSFSLIMLNTDLHNPQVTQKMTLEQWISNNRGIGLDGKDLERALLENLYHAVHADEIRIEQREYVHGASIRRIPLIASD